MRIMKLLGGKVLAVAIAMSMLPAAVPSNVPLVGVTAAKADTHHRRRHGGRNFYRHGGYYGGRHGYYGGRHRYYRDRYYRRHHRNDGGAALAGAVIGLGVGAALASQPRYDNDGYYGRRHYRAAPRRYVDNGYAGRREPWSRAWYNYCSARYRSFDARSGTFQPYHGPRQFCR